MLSLWNKKIEQKSDEVQFCKYIVPNFCKVLRFQIWTYTHLQPNPRTEPRTPNLFSISFQAYLQCVLGKPQGKWHIIGVNRPWSVATIYGVLKNWLSAWLTCSWFLMESVVVESDTPPNYNVCCWIVVTIDKWPYQK